jgi:hypothetical protein
MKLIKLNNTEIQFLNTQCQNNIIKKYLEMGHSDTRSSALVLMLSKEDLEAINNELTTLIIEQGMTDDGEINSFGKKIDELIDKFNHYE